MKPKLHSGDLSGSFCDSFAQVDTLQTASDPATLCNRSCLKQRLSF